MEKTSLLISGLFSLGLLTACVSNVPALTATLVVGTPSAIPSITFTPTPSDTSANATVNRVYVIDKYMIAIPTDFALHEVPSSPITLVPGYRVEAPNRTSFSIWIHPYIISSSPIPGKCVVSTDFDAGIASAPIFCEGMDLTGSFTVPGGWHAKYASAIGDLSLLSCTANSPCPVDVPPERRYSITYVFVIPDKSLNTILEFYAGDAFRGPSKEIAGFEGLGAVLYNSIIPSLARKNP